MSSVWETEGLYEFVVDCFKNPEMTYDNISAEVEKVFGIRISADAIRKKLSKSGFKKRFTSTSVSFEGFELQIISNLKPKNNSIYLFNLADLHIGDTNIDKEAILNFIDWVKKTPNAYGFVSGDIINIITKDSLGNIYNQKESPEEQIEEAIKILYPIRQRILKMLPGNHEARALKSVGIDPVREISSRLSIPYGSYVLCSIVFSEDVWYSVFGLHKLTNSVTETALIGNLKKMSEPFVCDIYLGAHSHKTVATKTRRFIIFKDKIIEQKSVFLSTIGFLKYSGYVLLGKMPPGVIDEVPILQLRTDVKEIKVII